MDESGSKNIEVLPEYSLGDIVVFQPNLDRIAWELDDPTIDPKNSVQAMVVAMKFSFWGISYDVALSWRICPVHGDIETAMILSDVDPVLLCAKKDTVKKSKKKVTADVKKVPTIVRIK